MENEDIKLRDGDSNKKKNRKKKIIIGISSVIICIVAALSIMYFNIRGKIYNKYTPEKKQEDSYSEVEGITNILLVGIDGRTLDEPARSDSIIIATIDNNTKKIKLTSIIRDTLVDIPEYGEHKINTAFYLGGIEEDKNGELKGSEGGVALLIDTIEANFKLHLDKYVIVNFWGFEDIIDTIGGIDIDVKDYEIDEVNKYIGESTELKSPPIEKTGLQTLNGQQALSYARIRYVGNGGYERAERQNRVISEATSKLRETNPLKYVTLANTVSNYVKTNMDIPFALNLAYTVYKMPSLNIEQLQIPQTELIVRDSVYKDKGWVLIIDLEQNSKVMYDFIFNDKLPNSNEFDLDKVYNLVNEYDYEEQRYNSIYGINPEDYNDDIIIETPIPVTPIEEQPVQEKPVEEKPVEQKPIEQKPVEQVPVQENPVQEQPVEQKPIEGGNNTNTNIETPVNNN